MKGVPEKTPGLDKWTSGINLVEYVEKAAELHRDRVLFRYKDNSGWSTMSYRQFLAVSRNTARGLIRIGFQPGDKAAIYSENGCEWAVACFATLMAGGQTVPIDAKLNKAEVIYILEDSETCLLFTSAAIYGSNFEEPIHGLDRLKDIIVWGESIETDSTDKAAPAFHSLQEIQTADSGKEPAGELPGSKLSPDSIASIIYTSGTTGAPKGVMLSHRNFMANALQALGVIYVEPQDCVFLVLPLHHAFPFTTCFILPLVAGASICFMESLKKIRENLVELQPTILVGVPALFQKLHDAVAKRIYGSILKKALWNLGGKKIIGNAVRRQLGGRLRLFICGAAAANPVVVKFFNDLGIVLLQGYGLTEASPVVSVNLESHRYPESIGKPVPGVEMDIFEPGPDGVGEIITRGENVMHGYYHREEETAKVLKNGCLHTGDLAYVENGRYYITGRQKNLIVTSAGKNISPEEIEPFIDSSPYIDQVMVLGIHHGSKGEVVGAIVVPNMENIMADFGKGSSLSENEIETILTQQVRNNTAGLADYKRPTLVRVSYESLEMTSTLKIKRYRYDPQVLFKEEL
jgi:long-chain acyl-CoA synthetase